MLACFAVAILLACVYYAGVYSTKRPSWGKFGGNCFEVLETGQKVGVTKIEGLKGKEPKEMTTEEQLAVRHVWFDLFGVYGQCRAHRHRGQHDPA